MVTTAPVEAAGGVVVEDAAGGVLGVIGVVWANAAPAAATVKAKIEAVANFFMVSLHQISARVVSTLRPSTMVHGR